MKNKRRKFGFISALLGVLLMPVMFFVGCGQDDLDDIIKVPQWLYGTKSPENIGNDGDFYIDTDDNLLYKKENGVWSVIMEKFGAQGEGGEAGKDGKTPTITINEDGYWVINGKDTQERAIAKDGQSLKVVKCEEINQTDEMSIYQITFSDGSTTTFNVVHGSNGQSISVVKCEEISRTAEKSTYQITFSDGSTASFDVKHGKDGISPTIDVNEDGYWVINGVVSEYLAKGQNGASVGVESCNIKSETATQTTYTLKFTDGKSFDFVVKHGTNGKDGKDGITPTVEINAEGYWVINGVETEVLAKGQNGTSVSIESCDIKNETATQTTYTLKFTDNKTVDFIVKHGTNGKDGETPIIDINEEGFWTINGEATDDIAVIKVVSCNLVNTKDNVDTYEIVFNTGDIASFDVKNGVDGKTPTIDIDDEGFWVINGVKIDVLAQGQNGLSVSIDSCNVKSESATQTIYTLMFTDGKSIDFAVKHGKDGITPTVEISDEGYWVINGVTTEVLAKGQNGSSSTIESCEIKTASDEQTIYTLMFTDGKTVDFTVKHGLNAEAPTIEINADGFWVVNGEATENVAVVKVVGCELVETNGNVDTYEIVFNTGDIASFDVKNGVDGETPTIDINEDGFWVINGEQTDISNKITHDELLEKLSGVIEYDSDKFNVTYEALKGNYSYDYNKSWQYDGRTMTGYGFTIGKPSEIPAIKFKFRKGKNETQTISQIDVELYAIAPIKDGATESEMTLVASDTLNVNLVDVMNEGETVYNTHEIIWSLKEKVINENNNYYYFKYICKNSAGTPVKIALFGTVGGYDDIKLPQEDRLNYTGYKLQYYTTRWATLTDNAEIIIPVQIGEFVPAFKISDSVIDDILEKIDVNKAVYSNDEILLDSTLYAYVGQKIELYFNNVSAYSTDDVRFTVETTKGTIYSDRWEYTAEAIETFSINVGMYTKDFKLINEKKISVVINSQETESSTSVLVIGDSTVSGGQEIEKMLELADADSNNELTFIGTLGSENNLHEGRAGWKLEHYIQAERVEDANPFYNTETSALDFSKYMEDNAFEKVDVVFIQLGINDMFGKQESVLNEAVINYVNNMKTLIDAIHAYDSNIKVIINTLFPCCPDQDLFGAHYGTETVWEYMRNIYFANAALINEFTKTDNVYVSWFNACLDASKYITKDVHPSSDGYSILGTQMYYYLKAILANV